MFGVTVDFNHLYIFTARGDRLFNQRRWLPPAISSNWMPRIDSWSRDQATVQKCWCEANKKLPGIGPTTRTALDRRAGPSCGITVNPEANKAWTINCCSIRSTPSSRSVGTLTKANNVTCVLLLFARCFSLLCIHGRAGQQAPCNSTSIAYDWVGQAPKIV